MWHWGDGKQGLGGGGGFAAVTQLSCDVCCIGAADLAAALATALSPQLAALVLEGQQQRRKAWEQPRAVLEEPRCQLCERMIVLRRGALQRKGAMMTTSATTVGPPVQFAHVSRDASDVTDDAHGPTPIP